MRVLRASSKFVFTASVVAGLVACGGGGGDSGGVASSSGGSSSLQPASSSTFTPFTQEVANVTAATGLLLVDFKTTQSFFEQQYFASFLQGFVDNSTGGSAPAATLSCNSGTIGSGSLTSTINKAVSTNGLGAGDSVTVVFDNCNFGTSTLNLNGSVTISPTEAYVTGLPLPANYKVQYKVTTADFTFTVNGSRFRSSGIQTVVFDGTAAGFDFPEINTTAGLGGYKVSRFNSGNAGGVPNITTFLKSAGTIYTKVAAADNFVTGVNGDIDVVTSTLASQSYTLATTTRLSGVTNANRDIPSAGVLKTKNTSLNLQTVTTVQGLNATVEADTNRDGVIDSSAVVSVSSLIN